ncbi:nuclear transport factor 2 family protein [Robiginitalea sp. IMCC43444]|uniref:nuclear transport factor 2 family protein n=1 Tax=Robiginitalea sp. IMCC43444 TaxID=3459121 RepID=UPI00404375BD
MKKYFAACSLVVFCLFPGKTLAQSGADYEAVKAVIDQFFEGFHKRDTAMMRSVLAEKVLLQTIGKSPDGATQLRTENMNAFVQSIGSIPDSVQIEEKLLDYSIHSDGLMANAWTPYEFYLRGTFSHCGVNSFQLYHDGNAWKIIYLVDTRKRKGCDLN